MMKERYELRVRAGVESHIWTAHVHTSSPPPPHALGNSVLCAAGRAEPSSAWATPPKTASQNPESLAAVTDSQMKNKCVREEHSDAPKGALLNVGVEFEKFGTVVAACGESVFQVWKGEAC